MCEPCYIVWGISQPYTTDEKIEEEGGNDVFFFFCLISSKNYLLKSITSAHSSLLNGFHQRLLVSCSIVHAGLVLPAVHINKTKELHKRSNLATTMSHKDLHKQCT